MKEFVKRPGDVFHFLALRLKHQAMIHNVCAFHIKCVWITHALLIRRFPEHHIYWLFYTNRLVMLVAQFWQRPSVFGMVDPSYNFGDPFRILCAYFLVFHAKYPSNEQGLVLTCFSTWTFVSVHRCRFSDQAWKLLPASNCNTHPRE